MTVTVKFFAALVERVGRSAAVVEFSEGMTVGDAWNAATGSLDRPEHLMTAVNMEYAKADKPLRDGDEVGFFPPVTGG